MTSYPFSDPDPIKLKEYTDSIYNASIALDIIKEYQSVTPFFSFFSFFIILIIILLLSLLFSLLLV